MARDCLHVDHDPSTPLLSLDVMSIDDRPRNRNRSHVRTSVSTVPFFRRYCQNRLYVPLPVPFLPPKPRDTDCLNDKTKPQSRVASQIATSAPEGGPSIAPPPPLSIVKGTASSSFISPRKLSCLPLPLTGSIHIPTLSPSWPFHPHRLETSAWRGMRKKTPHSSLRWAPTSPRSSHRLAAACAVSRSTSPFEAQQQQQQPPPPISLPHSSGDST